MPTSLHIPSSKVRSLGEALLNGPIDLDPATDAHLAHLIKIERPSLVEQWCRMGGDTLRHRLGPKTISALVSRLTKRHRQKYPEYPAGGTILASFPKDEPTLKTLLDSWIASGLVSTTQLKHAYSSLTTHPDAHPGLLSQCPLEIIYDTIYIRSSSWHRDRCLLAHCADRIYEDFNDATTRLWGPGVSYALSVSHLRQDPALAKNTTFADFITAYTPYLNFPPQVWHLLIDPEITGLHHDRTDLQIAHLIASSCPDPVTLELALGLIQNRLSIDDAILAAHTIAQPAHA